MRSALAERLLVKIMEWTPADVSKQRPLLQALASFKFDEYQQFSPGIRFIESLVKWLEQFERIEEKRIAYNFVLNHVIYISNDQLTHLVNITFSEKVNPVLIRKTASKLGVSAYLVNKITQSPEYKEMLRKSLFIGLSDGARIEVFRRNKREISNEQVLSSYDISSAKSADMIKELNGAHEGKFNSIFLIDDFTASGKSYFREEGGVFAGKVCKFLRLLYSQEAYKSLIETGDGLNIHLIFYIATRSAIDKIIESVQRFIKSERLNVVCEIDAVQFIEEDIQKNVQNENEFINLISRPEHFDDSIVDSHYRKGKCDKPYLGFDECSLPLILNHNTPNNSLPILWFPEGSICVGLFPRVTRHKDE